MSTTRELVKDFMITNEFYEVVQVFICFETIGILFLIKRAMDKRSWLWSLLGYLLPPTFVLV